MRNQQKTIKALQRQLEAHQKNLNFLEEQEAKFGPLAVPVELHNQLVKEREIIATLTLQLERLQHLQVRPGDTAARLLALAKAGVPSIAAVDNDVYWHGIVAEVATAFNFPTENYTVPQLVQFTTDFCRAGHRIAVIGLPTPTEFSRTVNLTTWTRTVVAVSGAIPTILLTSREARPVAIATRYSMLKNGVAPIATMQKETFTFEWFTKMFKKALEDGHTV